MTVTGALNWRSRSRAPWQS